MSEYEMIEEEAARWVAREDRELTAEERAELASWLKETPHRVAYLRLRSAWDRSARLAVLRGLSGYRARLSHWPHARPALAAAAAVLVLSGAAFGAWRVYQALENATTQEVVYATQAGERPIIHLADGTQIQLDANSRLHATISTANRVVTLEKGDAYFEVTHDADRPFVVMAGKHRISDLGTKFSVEKDGDDIRVVVTEGRVRVDNLNTLTPESPIFADRGNVVVAKADEMLLTTTTLQDLSDDLSWRDGRLIFNQQSLAEAAREFNRYNSRKLVVVGAARDIKIGGSFRADNMDIFVGLIQKPLGLTADDRGDRIILSKK